MDLTKEIAQARMRERERERAEAAAEAERQEAARVDRERYGAAAFAHLLGEAYLLLIAGYDDDPYKNRAWPYILHDGRRYSYKWVEHAHAARGHYWVRDDGAEQFFTTPEHASYAEQRRDQALLALAAAVELPAPPPVEFEGDDEE